MKYTYPSTLDHAVLECIWLWEFCFQSPRSGCFFFTAAKRGRRPLKMKYAYPSTLDHAVSECIRLWEPISKTLGVNACFFLHLQEGDALEK